MPTPPILAETVARIPPPGDEAPARAHLDSLTKPLGSLGRLEDLAAQLHTLGITTLNPAAYIFAADHGLAAEPISAYPQEVTRQMVLNFLSGGAAINVLARLHGAPLKVVNCGVAGPLPDAPSFTNAPIRPGSRNSLHEPAMTPQEFKQALALGLQTAANVDANLVAAGEMGIGNTSSAALLTAALTGRLLAEVTGRGTGLDDHAHQQKITTLQSVLNHHKQALGAPDSTASPSTLGSSQSSNPAEILRILGGLELTAMVAFLLGCAANRIAIILDGFPATAAAACALAFAPQLKPWLFAGHQSHEPGHRILLDYLGLTPILQLHMRLGEGTGAVLAIPILASALALYNEMATFTSANVSGATQ